MTVEEFKNNIDLENQYTEKVNTFTNKEGISSYEEFIENIVNIVNSNSGTIEDARFIAEDAIHNLKSSIYYELNNGQKPSEYEVIDTFDDEDKALEAFKKNEGKCELLELDYRDSNYYKVISSK